MKTIHQILSIFLGAVILTIGIALLTEGRAGNEKSANTSGITYEIITPAQLEHSYGIIELEPKVSVNPMLEDSKYWVNYLNSTIDTNIEVNIDSNDVVYQMENNPTYWVDNLKNIEE